MDFTLIAQYWSHIEDTLEYMERYLHHCHYYKVVFQEFWSMKKTRQEADANDGQLRLNLKREFREAGKMPAFKQRQLLDESCLERTDKREEIL